MLREKAGSHSGLPTAGTIERHNRQIERVLGKDGREIAKNITVQQLFVMPGQADAVFADGRHDRILQVTAHLPQHGPKEYATTIYPRQPFSVHTTAAELYPARRVGVAIWQNRLGGTSTEPYASSGPAWRLEGSSHIPTLPDDPRYGDLGFPANARTPSTEKDLLDRTDLLRIHARRRNRVSDMSLSKGQLGKTTAESGKTAGELMREKIGGLLQRRTRKGA